MKKRASRVSWPVLGLAVLLAGGMGLTVRDYAAWKRAEIEKFGQGRNELEAPAAELKQAYLNREAGVRIMIPAEWQVTAAVGAETESGMAEAEIIGRYMAVAVGKADGGSMTDRMDKRAAELATAGITTEERDYVRSETAEITIFEWRKELPGGEAVVRQEAWLEHEGWLLKIEIEAGEGEWLKIRNTVREIYRAIEWI